MTKKEAERRAHMNAALQSLGFTQDECDSLRRISMTLHSWYELECGCARGCIERDAKGKPYWSQDSGDKKYPTPDREAGAERRLFFIMEAVNGHRPDCTHHTSVPDGQGTVRRCSCGRLARGALTTYLQTDPRGAALYILRPGDVPEGGDPGSYYSRGICVY